jgi:hypothetical protein
MHGCEAEFRVIAGNAAPYMRVVNSRGMFIWKPNSQTEADDILVTRAGDRTLAEAKETAKVVADFLADFA